MSILEIYDNLMSDKNRVKKLIDQVEAIKSAEGNLDANIKNYYSYLLDNLATIKTQIKSIETSEEMVTTGEVNENSKTENS